MPVFDARPTPSMFLIGTSPVAAARPEDTHLDAQAQAIPVDRAKVKRHEPAISALEATNGSRSRISAAPRPRSRLLVPLAMLAQEKKRDDHRDPGASVRRFHSHSEQGHR